MKEPIEKVYRELDERYPTIAFCLPGNNFTEGFMMSWTQTVSNFSKLGWPFFVSNFRAADMHNCRNRVALGGAEIKRDVLPFGGKDYDYMMWIDSDMVWNSADIEKLIDLDKDIASGIYLMNLQGVTTCGYLKDNGNHRITAQYIGTHPDEPFKVDYNGFGFVLIKKGVFEKMGFPWFVPRQIEFEGIEGVPIVHASEDVAWCMEARDKGFDIWIDPSIKLRHQKRVTMDF